MTEQKIDTKRLAALIPSAQAGDADAFGDAYDILVAPIYRYIYYRVSSRELAEDLTETVFLKAWENLKKYKKQSGNPFSAWVFRIAHNLVIDYYRSRPRTETIELDESFVAEQREANPADATQMRFERSELRVAIHQLPEAYQQVIVLKFINEFSNAEVAAIMKRSEGSIRILQFRALAKMKALLDAPDAVPHMLRKPAKNA